MKEKDFSSMLSGVQRDGWGNIMSASATRMTWMGRMNASLALTEPADDSGTRGELVDLATAQFEKDLSALLLKYKQVEPENVRIEVKRYIFFAPRHKMFWCSGQCRQQFWRDRIGNHLGRHQQPNSWLLNCLHLCQLHAREI